MDLGKLALMRGSTNVEDLRASYTEETGPGGVKILTPRNVFPDTTVPWQANVAREPGPGDLGALAMSVKAMIDRLDQERFMSLMRAGIESRVAEDGGLDIRRYQPPPLPDKHPTRHEWPYTRRDAKQ